MTNTSVGISHDTNETAGGQDALRARRQRMRSVAIGWSLALLVALFYAATIVHMGGNVLNRAL